MFLSFLLFFLSSLFFHFSWVSSLTENVLTALLMINRTRCCKMQVKYSFIFLLFSFCLALSLISHFLFLFSSSAIDLFLALQKISLRRTWQCLWMSSYERSTIAFILLFILTLFLFYFSSIIYFIFLSCYCLLFLSLQNIFINHTSRSFWHIVFYFPFHCSGFRSRSMWPTLNLPLCLAYAGRHSDVQWSSHQMKLGPSCSHKCNFFNVKILYFLILDFRRSLCGVSKTIIFIVKGVWVEWILIELKFCAVCVCVCVCVCTRYMHTHRRFKITLPSTDQAHEKYLWTTRSNFSQAQLSIPWWWIAHDPKYIGVIFNCLLKLTQRRF